MNDEEMMESTDEMPLARFSDRVVAFSIDYALFTAGFLLSLKLFFRDHHLLINPHGMAWAILWIALFLAYQAVFSSEGRQTLGKNLLGLGVVDLNGEPLEFGRAAVRGVGYLLSSMLCGGFFWHFTNPARQTWHDMLGGSVVVELHPKSNMVRGFVRAGATACLMAFLTMGTWEFVLASHYYRNMTLAYAEVGLTELADLQEDYKAANGHYADNLLSLAAISGDPTEFMTSMSALFDPTTGIRIRVTGSGYRIEARARDIKNTPVFKAGP